MKFCVLIHLNDIRIMSPEDGGNKIVQNIGILLQHYIVSQSRRPELQSPLP
jgi:hypothetical protein